MHNGFRRGPKDWSENKKYVGATLVVGLTTLVSYMQGHCFGVTALLAVVAISLYGMLVVN